MRTDPFEFTSLKISTWFYLVLLISLTIIIVFFNWFTVRIDSNDVPYPTLDQLEKLYEEHPGSLQCPCDLIDIPHGSFVSISPRFHPVCTSFFTTNEWIDLMGSEYGIEDEIGYRDIFQVGPKFFTSLQTFCKIMETIVSNGFIIFNQSALVTNQTLSRIEFMKRTQQLFEQFTSNTIAEAKQSLALIRSQTVAMYTNGDTDISWRRSSHHNSSYLNFFQPVPIKIGNCSCKLREDCKQQLVYYGPWIETDPHSGTVKAAFYIANMFLGCFATESLLQSSLECIFDSNCMGHIISARYENLNVTLLEQNSSRFAAEILLQTIIDEIMIEKWNENINYSRYYEKCAPKICTYFVNSRNNALYALTTIIGLFGGLSTVLRIIVPRVVTWIRNKFYRRTNRDARTGSRTLRERLRTLWLLIKKKVLEVNLFESEASWDNEDRRRQEIVTTRLYLLLLISSLIIMILYTAVSVQIRSFTKENPSREYFERFVSNQRYSPTLDCPCQNISIQYNSFISITPYYHQLCSSDFIVHNSMWINLIYSESDLPQYAYDDYRQFILAHFRLLFDLCTLAKDTFTDALLTFRSNTFINTRAQSPQVVVAQIDANINQFRSSIPQAFMRTLDFIQQIAQGNGLVSSSVSNWYPVLEKTVGMIFMAPRTYGNNNCSCATNSKCVSSATIDEWIVPGFRIGCYPLESLLQSTLECLYNLTCINKLKNKKSFSNMTIRALNSTLSFPNATVQSLVDTLMVDRWESNIDYEKYYQSCAPVSCTYVIRERANSIYIITVIIGSFGGLTVALKILAPLIIKLVRYIIKWRGRRVVPNIAIIPLQ